MVRVSAPRNPAKVRSPIALRDVVRKTQHGFVVRIGPFHRRLDGQCRWLHSKLHRNRRVEDNGLFGAVQIRDKTFDPAFEMQIALRDGFRIFAAVIAKIIFTPELRNASSRKRFSKRVLKSNSVMVNVSADGMNVTSVPVRDRLFPTLFNGASAGSPCETAYTIACPLTADAQIQPFRQGVHNRNTDPVQTA
jgi:hypothetical protein